VGGGESAGEGEMSTNDEPVEQIRNAQEVARRCIVLYAVIVAGHGELRVELVEWLHREQLWSQVSPNESAFLMASSPTQQQQINATWRTEALFPLLWSLRAIATLPPPTQFCNVSLRSAMPPLFGSTAEFISSARLRPESEIRDANEEIYQIHWRVRDARLNGRPAPDGFDPSVVQERHHGLNWLIGYCGQDWDEISTDT
jgi:hypothetical protein